MSSTTLAIVSLCVWFAGITVQVAYWRHYLRTAKDPSVAGAVVWLSVYVAVMWSMLCIVMPVVVSVAWAMWEWWRSM